MLNEARTIYSILYLNERIIYFFGRILYQLTRLFWVQFHNLLEAVKNVNPFRVTC